MGKIREQVSEGKNIHKWMDLGMRKERTRVRGIRLALEEVQGSFLPHACNSIVSPFIFSNLIAARELHHVYSALT